MVSNKNKKEEVSGIEFMAGRYKITQKISLILVGYIHIINLQHQNYVNSIISKVNFRMYTIESKYMLQETK